MVHRLGIVGYLQLQGLKDMEKDKDRERALDMEKGGRIGILTLR